MKIFFGILYTALTLLLVSIAGVFLASMLPIPGHISIKIVKSGSMEPTIHTGSIVILKPADTYSVGDVITFGEDTKTQIPTTHRIIATDIESGGTFFTTKGDANEDPDPNKTRLSEVHGKVIASVPSAGYVLAFAKTPIGFALLIGLPAAIIILDELFKIFGEVRSMRKKGQPVKRRSEDEDQSVSMQELEAEPRTVPQRKSIDGVRHQSYPL